MAEEKYFAHETAVLDEGSAVEDFLRPERIVIGSILKEGIEMVYEEFAAKYDDIVAKVAH